MNLDKLSGKQIMSLAALLVELHNKEWVVVNQRHQRELGVLLEQIPTVTQQGVTYFNKPNNYWWFNHLAKDIVSHLSKLFKLGEKL